MLVETVREGSFHVRAAHPERNSNKVARLLLLSL